MGLDSKPSKWVSEQLAFSHQPRHFGTPQLWDNSIMRKWLFMFLYDKKEQNSANIEFKTRRNYDNYKLRSVQFNDSIQNFVNYSSS